MDRRSETEMVGAAMAGDGESFRTLCETYYGRLVATAYAVVGDHHLAEDAAQETLARACENLPTLKRKEAFGGWLGAICQNVARDMIRVRRERLSSEIAADAVDEGRDGELSTAVWQALERLSETDRKVVMLRYYDHRSYEDIAAFLRVSRGSVNGRLTRAKRKMAKYLKRKGFPRK